MVDGGCIRTKGDSLLSIPVHDPKDDLSQYIEASRIYLGVFSSYITRLPSWRYPSSSTFKSYASFIRSHEFRMFREFSAVYPIWRTTLRWLNDKPIGEDANNRSRLFVDRSMLKLS